MLATEVRTGDAPKPLFEKNRQLLEGNRFEPRFEPANFRAFSCPTGSNLGSNRQTPRPSMIWGNAFFAYFPNGQNKGGCLGDGLKLSGHPMQWVTEPELIKELGKCIRGH